MSQVGPHLPGYPSSPLPLAQAVGTSRSRHWPCRVCNVRGLPQPTNRPQAFCAWSSGRGAAAAVSLARSSSVPCVFGTLMRAHWNSVLPKGHTELFLHNLCPLCQSGAWEFAGAPAPMETGSPTATPETLVPRMPNRCIGCTEARSPSLA